MPATNPHPLRVAAAQIGSVPGDLDANLRKHLDAIDAARTAGVDVLLFPELSLTGHHGGRDARRLALERTHEHVAALAAATGPMLSVFGLVETGRTTGSFHNAVFAVRDGNVVHAHRKVNLATYGRLDDGLHFAAGDRIAPFAFDRRDAGDAGDTRDMRVASDARNPTLDRAAHWRIAALICADTWNPPLVHLAAAQHATLLLVATSSALEAVGPEFDNPAGWDVNLRFHALTYGLPVVMANRVGVEGDLTFWGGSRIVDPFGRVLALAAGRDEGLVSAELDLADVQRARTLLPTIRDANLPLLRREFGRLDDGGRPD